ncbi:hypothetical protein WJX74_000803 [Apatococcus lobatus]|uniref:Hedgehog protein Hint domain-containing protein n=2 Tax=Apatococcus TaxID=904362 RepID=A0AAW1T116_9CHLO
MLHPPSFASTTQALITTSSAPSTTTPFSLDTRIITIAPPMSPSPNALADSALPSSQASCFPGDVTVQMLHGRQLMRDLKLGDQVLTADPFGKQAFETIFMFSHSSEEITTHVTLTTQGNFSLSMTVGHYMWVTKA